MLVIPGVAAEDDEEGELADAETSIAEEEDGAAMDVDNDTAQGGLLFMAGT